MEKENPNTIDELLNAGLKHLVSTEEGKAVLRMIMDTTSLVTSIETTSADTTHIMYQTGRRDIGLELQNALLIYHPELYAKFFSEQVTPNGRPKTDRPKQPSY